MTGNFSTLLLSEIVVDREGRQRRELTNIEELAASIRERGLLHPIVVDKNNVLIAGERRLTAVKLLGWTSISVHYLEDLSPYERKLIELEENIIRVDLPWQDYVRSVAELHQLHSENDPNWTASSTAEAINMSPGHVSNVLLVHRNLDHPLVKDADKFSVAKNAAARFEERVATASRRDLDSSLDSVILGAPTPVATKTPAKPKRALILPGDFRTILPSGKIRNINFLHCDFPYGVNTGSKSGQSAAKITGHYEDSPELYFSLLDSFVQLLPSILAPSAHMMFWFSMDFYDETRRILSNAGWTVLVRPLIWHKSDNTGILPDPNRGPRQTYETAFFCSFGDRKVVKAVANSVGAAATRDSHTSEKPIAMLEHFFRMFVDESTRMLDPTAGSGNAVRVAAQLGADVSYGIELNPDFAARADANLQHLSDG